MNERKQKLIRKSLIVTGIVVAVLVGIGVLFDTVLGFNMGAATMNGFKIVAAGFAPWKTFWIAALAAAAVFGIGVAIEAKNTDSDSKMASSVTTVLAVVLLIGGFVMSISTVNRWGHDISHDQITKVLDVEDGIAPTYEIRDPYGLAVKRLERSLGNNSGYEVPSDNVWRFEVDGEPQTCGLKVSIKHSNKSPIRGVVCVSDTNKVTKANFDGKVPSWKVAVGHLRLAKVVNDEFPRGRYNSGDIYGYIDADGAHMVVPVTAMSEGLGYHEKWVGALVFGPDGKAVKVTDPAKVPGPVVGESTADRVLNALGNREGFMDWKRNRTKYDLSEGRNVKHFLLERADGSGQRLVTLLTPNGTSETVSAILEIDPNTIVDGWPKATLYKLDSETESGESRASVGESVDLVRQRYGAAMQLAESRNEILEATPGDTDELVVTVGTNQSVFARATVNMMTRETCVFTKAGDKVRCDDRDAAPLPIDGLRGLFSSNNETSDPAKGNDSETGGSTTNVEDLSNLSDAELNGLLRDIADELDARSAAAAPQTNS